MRIGRMGYCIVSRLNRLSDIDLFKQSSIIRLAIVFLCQNWIYIRFKCDVPYGIISHSHKTIKLITTYDESPISNSLAFGITLNLETDSAAYANHANGGRNTKLEGTSARLRNKVSPKCDRDHLGEAILLAAILDMSVRHYLTIEI